VLKLKVDGTVVWSRIIGDTAHVSNDYQRIKLTPNSKGYIIATQVVPENQLLYPGYFGGTDFHLFLIDSNGRAVADKKIGSTADDTYPEILPYDNGFILTGTTEGNKLNEGPMANSRRGTANSFIAFLEYWPLGILENPRANSDALVVYPNPARHELNVELLTPENGLLCLFTMDGKVVKQLATDRGAGSYNVPIGTLPAGNYLVFWKSKSGFIASQRVVFR
jgi:hypothetical protein